LVALMVVLVVVVVLASRPASGNSFQCLAVAVEAGLLL